MKITRLLAPALLILAMGGYFPEESKAQHYDPFDELSSATEGIAEGMAVGGDMEMMGDRIEEGIQTGHVIIGDLPDPSAQGADIDGSLAMEMENSDASTEGLIIDEGWLPIQPDGATADTSDSPEDQNSSTEGLTQEVTAEERIKTGKHPKDNSFSSLKMNSGRPTVEKPEMIDDSMMKHLSTPLMASKGQSAGTGAEAIPDWVVKKLPEWVPINTTPFLLPTK